MTWKAFLFGGRCNEEVALRFLSWTCNKLPDLSFGYSVGTKLHAWKGQNGLPTATNGILLCLVQVRDREIWILSEANIGTVV